ncbi:Hypothetical_protein [Hexamita inflata]|uniref:Hypothetical_protein n=1 Tax=Hexamita inflata TaxID=28002 RepID=A0AA86TYX4_9EUKA|nr:Hypothetical protein HINF_LOCUS21301 [Hexamita inflata]
MIFKECPRSLLNILNLVKFVKLIIQIFLQLLKSTILFTFKIVKMPSRKSNQYKVVFTEISESSFNCSFIDQYYVPLSRKMVLHTESASTIVETSNTSHFQIIQRIYPVKFNSTQMKSILLSSLADSRHQSFLILSSQLIMQIYFWGFCWNCFGWHHPKLQDRLQHN